MMWFINGILRLRRGAWEMLATIIISLGVFMLMQPFVMWGFTDKSSWIPKFFPGFNDALIFDRIYQPKPAYDVLMQVLKEEMIN